MAITNNDLQVGDIIRDVYFDITSYWIFVEIYSNTDLYLLYNIEYNRIDILSIYSIENYTNKEGKSRFFSLIYESYHANK